MEVFDSPARTPRKLWFSRVWLLLLWLFANPSMAVIEHLDAVNGEVDVSLWTDTDSYSLYGEWYFAGKELLTPASFLRYMQEGRVYKTTTIGMSLQQSAPEKFKNQTGFGTYILRLKNMPGQTTYAIAEIAAYVSARIFIFDSEGRGGEKAIRNLGHVSSNPRLAKSEISNNNLLTFRTEAPGDYYILIQIANHNHAWGGLWYPPTIGPLPVIVDQIASNLKANFFVFGVMIFIGFYNFMLFLYRREDRGSLYLAIVCLTLLTRTWVFNNYGQDYFGDGYWGVQVSLKVIYVTLFTLPWAAFRSAHDFFPRQTPRWMNLIIPPLCLVMILFVIATPSRIFGVLGNLMFGMGVVMGACCSYIAVKATIAREPGSRIIVLGISAVVVASIIELLNALNKIPFGRNGMTFGMTIYAACQSQIVSTRFAKAFKQAEHLTRELHSEVQRQTRDIRSLLDNLNQGIFTIVEGTMKVGSQFSAYLRTIIGRDRIEGVSLRELILDQSELNADRKDMIDAAVQSSLGDDLMNFEVNAGIFVREIRFDHEATGKSQYLELDWSPIFDQNERVEKLLISVRDVTELRQLREEARLREEDFEILKELVDVAEDRFMRFLRQARDFLEDNRRIIATPEERDSVQRLFINMHSLKGIARSYNLTLLANAVHHAEETLSALRSGRMQWNAQRLEEERHAVEAVCQHYERIALEKLGWAAAGSAVRLQKPVVEHMLDRLHSAARLEISAAARRELASIEIQLLELCHRSMNQVIDESSRGLDSLARSLGKEPPDMSVAVDGIVLQETTASTLHSVFTHLIRNSLDHGLETRDERLAKGKPAAGRIRIQARELDGFLYIRYEDDGRGLDLSRLEQKAREQGLWSDLRHRSDADIAELIFVSGLTTKAQVTEISGRGVGMDAVRSMLENLGGEIRIELAATDYQERRPFHLLVRLPGHTFIPSVLSHPQDIPFRNSPGF